MKSNKTGCLLSILLIYLLARLAVRMPSVSLDSIKDYASRYGIVQTEPQTETTTAQVIAPAAQPSKLRHFYSLLSSEHRIIYNKIYDTIASHGYSAELDAVDHDTLDMCFESVLKDHPEIYYVRGYTYYQNNYTKLITELSPNYSVSAEEMEYCNAQIDEYVNQFMSQAPVNGSEYDKIKNIYEYVINHTEYDLETEANQSLYGAFAVGRCACNGYAKAVQYLANKLGIYSVFVVGTASGNNTDGLHAWNIVRIDGNFYHVDATWGDNAIKTDGVVLSPVTYDYLCANDDIMLKNHFEDDFIDYPECFSLDNYYYVKEGLYFEYVDYDKLSAAFNNAVQSGENHVMLKCSDSGVLAQMKEYLLTEKNIFNYIYAVNVKTSEASDLNLIIFSW